jgi:hypothetical protein
MPQTYNPDPLDALGEAYEMMFETILKDLHVEEKTGGPTVLELVEKARQEAVAGGKLSAEQADRLAARLKDILHRSQC